MIIAIDGPAASGKSTTARMLANHLSITYIDTGAMYRAVALFFIENNLEISNISNMNVYLKKIKINLKFEKCTYKVFLNGFDVSERIRETDVSELSSKIAVIPEVRNFLVNLQRDMGKKQNVVLDGRDIGTVVFPDADFKFFMVADIQTRAKRRWLELKDKNSKTLSSIEKDLAWRDNNDSTRSMSPLKMAEDAIKIDTSTMTIEEQVNFIMGIVKKDVV